MRTTTLWTRAAIRPFAAILLSAILVLAGCGSDDGSSGDSSGSGAEASADSDNAEGDNSSGGDDSSDDQPVDEGAVEGQTGSTITVDGATFDATVFRCELEEDFYGEMPDPGDLDLAARSDGGDVSIDLIHRDDARGPAGELFEQQIHELRLNSPGEEYSNRSATNLDGAWFRGGVPALGDQEPGDPLNEPPFIVAGTRITGSMLLLQDFPEGTATVEVGFDLVVPSEKFAC
jgi:hypothetical protein